MRLDFKKSLFLGLSTMTTSFSVNAQEQTKPNVILFVADDHGLDALGCYGNRVIKTPNLDALARSGMRFENAYCTSSTSAASRSVLLTGQFGHSTASYGHTHDYHHFSTFDGTPSLPVLLAENGYHTARVGKYHLAPESVFYFDEVLEGNERNPVEMANNCKEVLNGDEPFFLYFCTGDPHRSGPFNPEEWNEPNSFGNLEEGYEGVEEVMYTPDEVLVPDFLPDNEVTRAEIAQYYQSVSRIDTGLGYLMEMLEKSGKADNTIVIYISDNGMAFPGAKTNLYEPGMKLPCIISGVGVKGKDRVDDRMISWVDLTPTILDITGSEYDAQKFHGKSIKGIIDGTDSSHPTEVFASHVFHEVTMYYPMRVLHQERYKLIWNIAYQLPYPFASDLWNSSTWQSIHRSGEKLYGKRSVEDFLQRDEFELYDLKSDPDEVHNLASEPEYAERLAEMIKQLKEWQIKTKDPWYIMWDNDMSMQNTGENL